MIRAQQALHEILLIGIDEEPQETLMQRARAIVEKFKADASACRLHVAGELAKLRDVVDREIDRRVDEDLVDNACDLLERLSSHLHAETSASPEEAARRHAQIAEAAYLRAAQRQFAPGWDLEDWLAAENALGLDMGQAPITRPLSRD